MTAAHESSYAAIPPGTNTYVEALAKEKTVGHIRILGLVAAGVSLWWWMYHQEMWWCFLLAMFFAMWLAPVARRVLGVSPAERMAWLGRGVLDDQGKREADEDLRSGGDRAQERWSQLVETGVRRQRAVDARARRTRRRRG